MLNIPGPVRLWITAGFLLGASVFLHTMNHGETIVPRRPLGELPYSFAPWTGEEHPIEQRILHVAGVSDYTNRLYVDYAGAPISLYIGYYASQRTGDTIHSPKNCLPGAGWDPIHSGYTTLSLQGGRQIVVNEYVIQQDLNKQMVFYWYQSRGRVIASEYTAKFWMIADAISRNRTDGALVRVITPMNDSEVDARARLTHFTQILFPYLDGILPN
jgi:EpsI family protein